jgi:hypothetical protein
MEKSEQRFIVKFFLLKSLGSKAIQRELIRAFGYTVRPRGPLHFLGKALSDFLEEISFGTAEIIAQYFNQSRPTIKNILQRGSGRERFSRR